MTLMEVILSGTVVSAIAATGYDQLISLSNPSSLRSYVVTSLAPQMDQRYRDTEAMDVLLHADRPPGQKTPWGIPQWQQVTNVVTVTNYIVVRLEGDTNSGPAVILDSAGQP